MPSVVEMKTVDSNAFSNMVVNGTPPGNPSIDDRPNPLKIAVVGAGIGGICVAIALRRQGHEVEV